MDRYTIYCTEEQTRTALALGAPIIKNPYAPIIRYETCGWIIDDNKEFVYLIPTADQMTGWLEEQEQSIEVSRLYRKNPNWAAFVNDTQIIGKYYPTRKEAILAAIDAALDYLIKTEK